MCQNLAIKLSFTLRNTISHSVSSCCSQSRRTHCQLMHSHRQLQQLNTFVLPLHCFRLTSPAGCELYAFCGALFGICGMMTLMVIAVDRYVVITRPLASLGVMSRRKALGIVAAAWVYSMGWSLPPFFGWSEYDQETEWLSSGSSEALRMLSYVSAFLSGPLWRCQTPSSVCIRLIWLYPLTMPNSMNRKSASFPWPVFSLYCSQIRQHVAVSKSAKPSSTITLNLNCCHGHDLSVRLVFCSLLLADILQCDRSL